MKRRTLLSGVLFGIPLARALSAFGLETTSEPRIQLALRLRQAVATTQSERPVGVSEANSDEASLPNWIACYTKGLPQNQLGEVDPRAYRILLAAIASGKPADFERVPLGAGRKLSNPQAAFAFHLEGGDPHRFGLPPAPSIASQAIARETTELYWQSLCRDVAFLDYERSPLIKRAAEYLGIPPHTIFRGDTRAALEGPYISQFLLKPVPLGTANFDQRYRGPLAGSDFMTTVSEWSQIEAGMPPWREVVYDQTPRYIRNGRDLAEWTHYDFAYQAYLNAALILLDIGPRTVLNANPFKSLNNPYRTSHIQEGFVTFGAAEVTDWLARVTTAALKAAWCQKWMVHRRLRPEALGGLVHFTRTGARSHPISSALLESQAVKETFSKTGTYLLPQAYPEGSPLHPSYPAGHAAVGGACSVVLKAFFNENMLLPGCVMPTADGLSLLPCTGYSPSVGAEVDKLAFNIALSRNWAGIHFRSDDIAGLRLGEDVGISILQDLVCTYTESFKGFSFTRIDGTKVQITPQGEVLLT